MTVALDKRRFGPWALVTGASSGIGKEFARQIAASGIHVAWSARESPYCGMLVVNAPGCLVSSTGSSLSTFLNRTSSP
ncbi:MAG TPA: SDR family NAD(P)-dependent oxidoreductase, partial [Anaerolineales bacterium]|nr:SDR family NAD(P)-dependent oxidoreductase [Anaerolineales bacterium]